jgi:hypothetical protein
VGSASTTLPSGAIGSKLGLSAVDANADGFAPAFDLSKFLSGIPVPQMAAPDPMMQALMDQNADALQATLQRQARMDTSSILARYGSQLVAANRAAT